MMIVLIKDFIIFYTENYNLCKEKEDLWICAWFLKQVSLSVISFSVVNDVVQHQ
jgi:hypothetical protein